MRACIQRVSSATVALPEENNKVVGQIGRGFLILLGIGVDDTEVEASKLAKKIAGLRVFDDEEGKMNLNLASVNGEVLVVSQFTLYADCVKGNRPSFIDAARPERAVPLYRFFISELVKHGLNVEEGVFQANMNVSLTNAGPVTIWIDTRDLKGKS